VYSGFAIVILLLIWLYVCWMVLLMGCHVVFLLQHPEFLERHHSINHMGGELLEHMALLIMALVGRNFIEDRPPWKASALAKHTRLPPRHVYQVIELLLRHGYLTEGGLTQTHLLPERDLSSISIKKLIQDMRSSDTELRLDRREQHPYDKVASLMSDMQQLQDEAIGQLTLRDLAAQPPVNQSEK
jgi:membrane protein